MDDADGDVPATGVERHESVDTEDVPTCCLCGRPAVDELFPTHDRLYLTPGRFTLVRCRTCGLVRLSPRPAPRALPAYYPEETYYSYRPTTPDRGSVVGRPGTWMTLRAGARSAALAALGYPAHDLPAPVAALSRRLVPRRLLQEATYGVRGFPAYTPGGRALDVGCGNGAFLAVLEGHGWDVHGVDISPAACRAAAARGIDVQEGTLEDVALPEASLDYIRMTHVVEHVQDPLAMLQAARRLLRPDGVIYLETPNIASIAGRRCGPYWYPLESPRHLWLFDPGTLRRLLGMGGFAVQAMTSDSFGRRPFSAYRWESTYRAEERAGRKLPERPVLPRRDLPRAVALATAARLTRVVRPDSDEILCCWASPTTE